MFEFEWRGHGILHKLEGADSTIKQHPSLVGIQLIKAKVILSGPLTHKETSTAYINSMENVFTYNESFTRGLLQHLNRYVPLSFWAQKESVTFCILFKVTEPGVTWPYFVTNGKEYKVQTCDDACKAEIDKCKGGEKCEIKAEVSENGDEPFIVARTLKVLPKKPSDPDFDKHFDFAEVEPGEFSMGSPSTEEGRDSDEAQHRVKISKGFEIGKTEVTQGMWKKVMGSLPKEISKQDDNLPITYVSWNEIQDFMGRLNGMRRGDGYAYRLPTEAEWEYAARGAQKASPAELGNAYSFGNSPTGLDDHAWSYFNSKDGVKPVATRKANQLGLSDMHGNVWEWTQDAYRSDYEKLSSTDPSNDSGSSRVIRGGGWNGNARHLRSAARSYTYPGDRGSDLGFRLLRTPNP